VFCSGGECWIVIELSGGFKFGEVDSASFLFSGLIEDIIQNSTTFLCFEWNDQHETDI
jgi:hypothetical protein